MTLIQSSNPAVATAMYPLNAGGGYTANGGHIFFNGSFFLYPVSYRASNARILYSYDGMTFYQSKYVFPYTAQVSYGLIFKFACMPGITNMFLTLNGTYGAIPNSLGTTIGFYCTSDPNIWNPILRPSQCNTTTPLRNSTYETNSFLNSITYNGVCMLLSSGANSYSYNTFLAYSYDGINYYQSPFTQYNYTANVYAGLLTAKVIGKYHYLGVYNEPGTTPASSTFYPVICRTMDGFNFEYIAPPFFSSNIIASGISRHTQNTNSLIAPGTYYFPTPTQAQGLSAGFSNKALLYIRMSDSIIGSNVNAYSNGYILNTTPSIIRSNDNATGNQYLTNLLITGTYGPSALNILWVPELSIHLIYTSGPIDWAPYGTFGIGISTDGLVSVSNINTPQLTTTNSYMAWADSFATNRDNIPVSLALSNFSFYSHNSGSKGLAYNINRSNNSFNNPMIHTKPGINSVYGMSLFNNSTIITTVNDALFIQGNRNTVEVGYPAPSYTILSNYGINASSNYSPISTSIHLLLQSSISTFAALDTLYLRTTNDTPLKLTAGNWVGFSDSNVKTNIQSADLERCYTITSSLKLSYYRYISSISSDFKLNDTHMLGYIAQDVQPIFPKAVQTTNYNSSSILSLDLTQIQMAHYGTTQYMISSIQERSTLIQNQFLEIQTLLGNYSTLVSLTSD
jgi:hypothetical protein